MAPHQQTSAGTPRCSSPCKHISLAVSWLQRSPGGHKYPMFFALEHSLVTHALISFLQQSSTNCTHQSLSLFPASWQVDATVCFLFSQRLGREEAEWSEARALSWATLVAVDRAGCGVWLQPS